MGLGLYCLVLYCKTQKIWELKVMICPEWSCSVMCFMRLTTGNMVYGTSNFNI